MGNRRSMLSHQRHTAKEGFNPGLDPNRVLAAAARSLPASQSTGTTPGRAVTALAVRWQLMGPCLEALKSHPPSSRLWEAVMPLRAQRVRPLGHTAEEPGLRSQHTLRILKPKSHRLISAQRGGTKCFSLPS